MTLSIRDTQHNDTQQNEIQLNDTQHKGLICDTGHEQNSTYMTLSITTPCFKCYYADGRYAECRHAECHGAPQRTSESMLLNFLSLLHSCYFEIS